ncbi:MAG TPA: hypothetical protein VLR94_03415 [Acidobacteriota bacterium]|nr:hypothetical protein [Acidobacteriota bacterium]
MKSRLLRGVLFLALLACFTAIGYQGYRWHAARERKIALSQYFRQVSPVTKRMPSDAVFYLNLYNARRLLDGIQNTRLSKVYNHWLDTGLGDDKAPPNSMVGGVMEKTILNVAGDELGVAIAPGSGNGWDFVAAARLVPGSDFLLKFALSQNKKFEHVAFGDETIFALRTRNAEFPRIFLYLDSDFAYASNSLERIRASAEAKGSGPLFLNSLPDEALPENTILFIKGSRPRLSALVFLEGKRLRLHTECDSLFEGPMPNEAGSNKTILELLTNIPEAFHQPAISYSIHSMEGAAVSTLLLAFEDGDHARDYENHFRTLRTNDSPQDSPGTIHYEGFDCSRFLYRKRTGMICARGALLLLLDGTMDPQQILNSSGVDAPQKRPLTVRLTFNRKALSDYASLADQGDWGSFAESKALFFLSCIRGMEGGVDDTKNEIVVEYE